MFESFGIEDIDFLANIDNYQKMVNESVHLFISSPLPKIEDTACLANIDNYQKMVNESVHIFDNLVQVEEDMTDLQLHENYNIDTKNSK